MVKWPLSKQNPNPPDNIKQLEVKSKPFLSKNRPN